jgi:hypothetical protein
MKYYFTEEKLPVFYLDFDEEMMNAGMEAVSFVDKPATQIKWEVFQSINDSFNDYPFKASENACRAIKYRENNPSNDCGTRVGWTRAAQLCNRRNITIETISRMASFKRHQQNKDVPYDKGCGGLMWDAWGGDEGINYAIRKMEFINNRLKASAFEKFETINEEKRIVSSPVMLAETEILRYSPEIGKYYVKFSKETIEKMMKKYFKENKIHKVNLNHDPKSKQDKIYMIESYIVGDRNKSNLFSDLPDGTWVASFLVENEEVWEKIKDGTFQGFSLEGYFVDKYEEELISNIENKLEKIINSDMGDNEKEMKIKQLLNIE